MSKSIRITQEDIVIGSLLRDSNMIAPVAEILSEKDFLDFRHRETYALILAMHAKGERIDPILVAERLPLFDYKEGHWITRLVELTEFALEPSNAALYAQNVKEQSRSREVNALLQEAQRLPNDRDRIEFLREGLAKIEKPSPAVTKPFNLTHVLKNKGEPRENLLHPWLPKAGLCMVYADTGVGKTFFCLNAAYAIASGGNFLKFSAPQPARVLYIDGEMSYAVMQPRIASVAAIQGEMENPDNFLLLTCDQFQDMIMPKISTLEGQATYNKIIKDYNIKLVIADNISSLTHGDESSAQDWGIVQDWAIGLRSNGISLLLVHHTSKDPKNQRGTTKRRDVLDTEILLQKINTGEKSMGTQFNITYTKTRNFFGEEAEGFEASLDKDGKWHMKSKEQSTFEKVVELANLGMSYGEIAIDLHITKSTAHYHGQKAIKEGLIKTKSKSSPTKGRFWEKESDT